MHQENPFSVLHPKTKEVKKKTDIKSTKKNLLPMWRLKSTKENMGSVCVDIFLNPRCPTAKCYSKSCGNWHSKLQRMSNLKIATTVQQIFRSLHKALEMARLLMWEEPKGNGKFAVLKSSLSRSLVFRYRIITSLKQQKGEQHPHSKMKQNLQWLNWISWIWVIAKEL